MSEHLLSDRRRIGHPNREGTIRDQLLENLREDLEGETDPEVAGIIESEIANLKNLPQLPHLSRSQQD